MKKWLLFILISALVNDAAFAQNISSDSTPAPLNGVIVRAYEHNRYIRDIGAAVNLVREVQLSRFGTNSLVAALNTAPGVRMEERSPGSYRINIRGSSLRSPFGIRNVKVYWNDIPFTDPSGNTYFNQFSFYNISSLEILKGPGSSLYGAGTGGVILASGFNGSEPEEEKAEYSRGSFNSGNLAASITFGKEAFRNRVGFTTQHADGYRQQSSLLRKTFSWETAIHPSARFELNTHVLYGDLTYQTPGGLTLAQYLANPKAARPAAAAFPSAIQARATIYQKTFWAGIHQQFTINSHWQQSTSVYGAYTNLKNPTIRNYEKRSEPHFGGRTSFTYSEGNTHASVKWTTGAEAQQGYFSVRVFGNRGGNPDTVQTDDEVNSRSVAVFSQAELNIGKDWILTLGSSLNQSRVSITRASVVPNLLFTSNYKNEWAPRASLLRKLGSNCSVYAVVSKGFSPPSTQELLPSTSIINTGLQAEKGWNYELGTRGTFFQNRLTIDVNAFYYRLNNAIVQRKDASGADYFTNAGSTKQSGIESSLSFAILGHPTEQLKTLTFWASHSYHHFRYDEFKQVASNYGGHQIPGDPKHAIAAGIDAGLAFGLTANLHYYYNDPIMLNDANTDRAKAYHLLGAKLGYTLSLPHKIQVAVFGGVENIFNVTYSNGNDINATGGRYYNAAPGINYYAGLSFQHLH